MPKTTDLADIALKIETSLSEILVVGSCLARIREAHTLLSPQEVSSLNPEAKQKWEKFAAREAPEERRLEWSEARRCEREIHEKLGAHAVTSIAHTRQEGTPVVFAIGAAADQPTRSDILQLGIDVELRSREVSEAVARRFTHPGEERLGLSALEIWVVKEALFKADPRNAGTTVTAHSIIAWDSANGHGKGRIEDRESEFALLRSEEWVVAIAVSRPCPQAR